MTLTERLEAPASTNPRWDEARRLAALERYGILDTGREAAFDDVAELASLILDAPIAVVNFIAADRQWFKAEKGIGQDSLPLDVSICRHAILQPGVLVVPDLKEDERFVHNPLVEAAGGLRFYAGASLETPDGLPLGTVCVLDTKPRAEGVTAQQERALRALAAQTMVQLELRRSAAVARAESERLTAVFEQSFAGLSEVDQTGRFLRVNDRYCEIVGRRREELLALRMHDITHPDDLVRNVPLFDEGARGGAAFEIVKRYLRPDGSFVWVHNSVTALRGAEGQVTSTLCVTVDISERKKAEEALRELNATLERRVAEASADLNRVWNNASDIFIVVDGGGTFRRVNPAVTPVLGWCEADLVGRSVFDFIHPDDIGSSMQALEHARDDVLPTFENRYRAKDGGFRTIAWLAAPEGDCIYAYGRDVTEEKRQREKFEAAEAARREADVLYRTYFEHTPEALFVVGVEVDGGFVVQQVNPAHEAGVGLRLADIQGRRVDEVLPVDMAEKVLETYRQVVASGTMLQYREVYDVVGGPKHWDTSIVPVRDADGRIVRLIGSSRDVTRQVVAEEALRQSQKMEAMGQLTGGVAHDFNNLLTPIVGALDMLQRRGSGGEREQRLIDGAIQSADRAKTLVQRLLAFARRQPLQRVAVDVAKLVTGMADLVSSTTGPQIKVVVDVSESLPSAMADPNQLEMALLNLAVNARDAMPDGGTLRISASAETIGTRHRSGLQPGTYVRLSVADTGTGMDEATTARAVEPFFSTKGVGKGTGLGLSMVHGLASQLGGALTIQSRPGLGTNVELWLPKTTATPETVESPRGNPATPAMRGTVLLVDDEELVRLSTAEMLGEIGYAVVEASSAEEAIGLIRQSNAFSLLLTDHLMPGMSGTDLAREVRSTNPGMPVLIVSGYAETDGVGADLPRLSKPFRRDELASSIAQVTNPA